MKKNKIVIVSAIFLIILFVIGSWIYKNQQSRKLGTMAKENAARFVRDHSQTLGSDDAKVTIVEFLDPGCETCRAFAPFIKSALDAYPGKIRLVIRYAPLHQGSDYMVKILEAARKQGKYWETLQVMYDSQPYWASHHNPQPQLIWQYLPKAGVDLEKIRNDMHDPEIAGLIAQDITDARTLNVRKTPEFFVNGKPLVTFGHKQLKALILSELRANYDI